MKPLIQTLLFCTLLSGTSYSCKNDDKQSKNSEIIFDSSKVKVDTLLPENIIIADTTNPDELMSLIKRLQRKYVRESWGLQEGECFTELNLKEFRDNGILYKIISSLQSDRNFAALVEIVRRWSANRRSEFFRQSRKHV